MAKTALTPGTFGQIDLTPLALDGEGKWKRHTSNKGADAWRGRVHYTGHDGIRGEVSTRRRTKREAESAVRSAVAERLSVGDLELKPSTLLVRAGEVWLEQIARSDSGLSNRTVLDYGRTWRRYVTGSSLRGLSLEQVNNPQRLGLFLREVADTHGTGAAKMAKTVLSGVLNMGVSNGALATNATKQVRPVQAQVSHTPPSLRDTTRAFTRSERDALVSHGYGLAEDGTGRPTSARKRLATADLLAFLAGTGVRISEARSLRWEHVDLTRGTADVYGTKSKSALRRLTLPTWLTERLRARAETVGTSGYVFAAPHLLDGGETLWDQSNSARAVATVLDGAGFPWATPHTFRRTVATLAHQAGSPLVHIADQLGHRDPSMTASVYLGRDPMGDRTSLAEHL